MRASRLLAILILLQLRVRLTADALARQFEVSQRTIYRDIDALGAAGVPIYGDRGPGGGFQLLDGYQTRLTGLTTAEAEALFLIGLPGPAGALGLGTAAQRAGDKLLASLPRDWLDEAGRIRARFHLDPLDWYRRSETVEQLPAIARAVLDQNVVTMRYLSWRSERDWTVEPLGLVLKAAAWYLVAGSERGLRIFKVANIREQRATGKQFQRPADFDLASHWQEQLQRFEATLRPHTALLLASKTGLHRLAQTAAYAEQAVAQAITQPDGWSQLHWPYESLEQAALLLLSIGPELEVLEPSGLRAAVATLASTIADRHRDPIARQES